MNVVPAPPRISGELQLLPVLHVAGQIEPSRFQWWCDTESCKVVRCLRRCRSTSRRLGYTLSLTRCLGRSYCLSASLAWS